jgi:hypothetical protein
MQIPETENECVTLATVTYHELTGAGRDVLMQMFLKGPVWDGNLIAKSGRSELVEAGLAKRAHGWQWLTDQGAIVAVFAPQTKTRADKRWRQKQACI